MKRASNREVTLLRKLNRKKQRRQEQLFMMEGGRGIRQLLENGIVTVETFFFDESQNYWQRKEWSGSAFRNRSRLLAADIFAEVSDTDNPQGILALCRIPGEATADFLLKQQGIMIATDAIQDPGNLGTMIRTAEWFGAKGILLGKGTVDMFHPKVVRSTAGATGSVPYRNAGLETELETFEESGWNVVLLDAGPGTVNLREVTSAGQTLLVIGNEANGIASALFGSGRTPVEIPSASPSQNVESLNAAVALSIALYALSG